MLFNIWKRWTGKLLHTTVFFFGIDVLNIYHTESLEMGRQVKFKINATKRALPHTSTLQCKLSVDLNAQMRCTQLMKKIAYSDDVLNCKECL